VPITSQMLTRALSMKIGLLRIFVSLNYCANKIPLGDRFGLRKWAFLQDKINLGFSFDGSKIFAQKIQMNLKEVQMPRRTYEDPCVTR
jgi:hypothetical protein